MLSLLCIESDFFALIEKDSAVVDEPVAFLRRGAFACPFFKECDAAESFQRLCSIKQCRQRWLCTVTVFNCD